MTITTSRKLTWLILLAGLFAGLAALAVLPPWEGADETAHWSYIQQLADTGKAPVAGTDMLSTDLDSYAGPRAYGDSPPYDQTSFATYRSLHRAPPKTLEDRPSHFGESAVPNWEAQHPLLYYVLLTPIYHATQHLTYRDHLFFLRLASWLLAFGGIAVGALATSYLAPDWARPTAPLLAAWPFLVPQVLPDLARMGNDSLCLLECSLVWLLLLLLEARPLGAAAAAGGVSAGRTEAGRPAVLIGLGVALGLGLLTKAFFIPISVGLAGYLIFAGWRQGAPVRGLRDAVMVMAIAAAIGAWWYVRQYGVTHDITGGTDFQTLKHQGGLATGLDRNYSAAAMARGVVALVATFAWTGTWSLARPPEVFILGPILLVAIPLVGWLISLRKAPTLAWAPLFLMTPMVAGLGYHIVTLVAMTGRGAGTPGYYLHILAAPLAFAVALGWRRGLILPALWVYTGLFTVAVWTLEVSLFSGCAGKLGNNPHYSFSGATCFVDLHQLQLLGHPLLAAGFATISVLGVAACLAVEWSSWRTASRPVKAELVAL